MSKSLCPVTKLIPSAYPYYGPFLDFLDPKDLARAERVCRGWNNFISLRHQWKKQCQIRLNIPTSMDPNSFLPKDCRSYKKGIQLASTNAKVLNAKIYKYYLGAEIELVSSIKEISLEKRNEPDPCDPTKTKGQKYVWIDSPSYFKITVDGDFPFELDKQDDPNNEEAPRLIEKKVSFLESLKRKMGIGSKLEKRVLKVPNTINNLGVLFKYPKYGHPSTYDSIWEPISAQHGNKRIPQGRICMREDVIGKNLTFAQQQAAAKKVGVIIPQLGHRILFNFLRYVETKTYPDGEIPRTYARTATLAVDAQGIAWPLDCAGSDPSGLRVDRYFSNINSFTLGVAVALRGPTF
jgi:hypothetical protein